MAIGFHLVVLGDCPAHEVLQRVDQAAQALGFSAKAGEKYGSPYRFYRMTNDAPELSFAFDFQPHFYQAGMCPLAETEVSAHGPEVLIKLWSSTCICLNSALGRTFRESGHGSIEETEIKGSLQFLDWYQYFSRDVVSRWGVEYLRKGPIYKVEEYSNGACGVWLAASPFERLGRIKAAEYLGVKLPKLYGKNPKTGEPMEIAWS